MSQSRKIKQNGKNRNGKETKWEVATRGALAQVFSCEFCEITKNTYFTEHIWVIASRAKDIWYLFLCYF